MFTIIGSVIGAGFITGKEISVFFCRDFSLSGVYAAFVFFFLFIFLLSVCEENALNKVVGFVVAVTGIVIASCMTAALNYSEVCSQGFSITRKTIKYLR